MNTDEPEPLEENEPAEELGPETGESPCADGNADELDEEFSLETLSAAYAEALAAHSGEAVTPVEFEDDEELDEDAEAELEGDDAVAETEDAFEAELTRHLAACPVTPESIVEAILFVGAPAGKKLSSRQIAGVLRDVSPTEVTQIAKALGERYREEGRAYQVKSNRGIHEFSLVAELASLQHRFLGRDRAVKLSQAAIDVLAVVAYNQPVSRAEVDKIRARPSGSILNQMVRRQLLKTNVDQANPRVKLFETTDRFLEIFELSSIDDLPQTHDLDELNEFLD